MKIILLLVASILSWVLFNSFNVLSFEKLFSAQTAFNLNSQLALLKKNAIACPPPAASANGLDEISINDNRKPAGELRNGVLHLNLEIRRGNWYPETHDGMPIVVYALGEVGKPLQIPGPLIRVPEGTEILCTVRNAVIGTTLMLHGFYSRPGNSKDSVAVSYGNTYEAKFKVGAAGTYSYRVSANSFKRPNRLPFREDSQLYGAFIIDKKNEKIDPEERILMIGIWNDTLNGKFTFRGEEKVINGLSWPYTERLTYNFGKKINWRLINTSNQLHPMHLHGFYYTVNSKGNGDSDYIYQRKDRRLVVTESLNPNEHISMTWEPDRAGNWVFHCHFLTHIGPESVLRPVHTMNGEHVLATHARDGMGGLIMGISVLPSANGSHLKNKRTVPKRTLTLFAKEEIIRPDTQKVKAFALEEKNKAAFRSSVPGPVIILTRNEPVAINVVNKLLEPTSVHWHGLEIESYFDGVAGWGNRGNELAPLVMPGDSFMVYMTPPRAGTFMYHTHMHNGQLLQGMYGPLIVLTQAETFEPETDKIFVISQGGPDFNRRKDLLNGTDKPDTLQLKAGTKYRFRLINIKVTTNSKVSFLSGQKPVNWKMIAKDGMDLPPQQKLMKQAVQDIAIGETMDFEFTPAKPGHYVFEVNNTNLNGLIKMPVRVMK